MLGAQTDSITYPLVLNLAAIAVMQEETKKAADAEAAAAAAQAQEVEAAAAKTDSTTVAEAAPDLATRAADVLIEALLADQQSGQAYEVAQTAIRRDPQSSYVFRFSRIRPAERAGGEFSYDLGYRIEYDDNVTFPDEVFASGEEDFRHVLLADLNYQRPFGDNWSLFAQGHFFQSFHHELDEFNQTRLVGSAAVGQTGRKMGWRFPLEFSIGPEDRMIQAMPFVGPLRVTARLDADGNATTRNPGDLQGAAPDSVSPGASDIEVVLDEVL